MINFEITKKKSILLLKITCSIDLKIFLAKLKKVTNLKGYGDGHSTQSSLLGKIFTLIFTLQITRLLVFYFKKSLNY